jgi:hypothetical protein
VAFRELLTRNRRPSKVDPPAIPVRVKKQYAAPGATLMANRARFAALDGAIDRIVRRLVGLSPERSLP